jgi:hypothetical protein
MFENALAASGAAQIRKPATFPEPRRNDRVDNALHNGRQEIESP